MIYLTDGIRGVRTNDEDTAVLLESWGWRRCSRREYEAIGHWLRCIQKPPSLFRRIIWHLTLPWRAMRVYKIAPVLLCLLEDVPEEVWANDVEFSGMNEGVEQVRSIILELRRLLGK